jgi:hypothetical protein
MRATLVVVALLAAVLTACGGGGADSPDAATESFFDALASSDGDEACSLANDDAETVSTIVGFAFDDAPDAASCSELVSAVPEDQRSQLEEVTVETTEESESEATVEVTLNTEGAGEPLSLDLAKEGEEWTISGLAIADVEI